MRNQFKIGTGFIIYTLPVAIFIYFFNQGFGLIPDANIKLTIILIEALIILPSLLPGVYLIIQGLYLGFIKSKLIRSNQAVDANIIKLVEPKVGKNKYFYHVICKAKINGIHQEFISDPYIQDPSEYIEDNKITKLKVYYNPDNLQQYYVEMPIGINTLEKMRAYKKSLRLGRRIYNIPIIIISLLMFLVSLVTLIYYYLNIEYATSGDDVLLWIFLVISGLVLYASLNTRRAYEKEIKIPKIKISEEKNK